MPPRVNISKELLERLYYDDGLTQPEIAERLGCGATTVSRRMREYGLEARWQCDYTRIALSCEELRELYVERGLSQAEIAELKDCHQVSVHNRMRECGIPARPASLPRAQHVPRELLAAWPTPRLAYVVGLLAADGSLAQNRNTVTFASIDREQIENYRACLELGPQTSTYTRPSPKESWKPCHIVQFDDHAFYQFLLDLGLTPANSLTIGPLQIPDNVFLDFARGCWDGDGGFCTSGPGMTGQLKTYVASGSQIFLEWMHDQLERFTGLSGSITSKELIFYSSNAVKLGHWLYYAPGLPALNRKRQIWQQFAQR